jgi:glycosyltransferase involved in cell wall biosynthesis
MRQDCSSHGIRFHPLESERDRIPARSTPGPAGRILDMARLSLRLMRIARSVSPDVIHLTLGWHVESPYLVWTCGLLKTPTLVTFQLAPYRVPLSPFRLKAYAWARARNQQWVTVSQQNWTSLCETFAMPREQAILIYNGIEPEAGLTVGSAQEVDGIRQAVRQELGFAPDTKILLTVARLGAQKGHADLIEVIRSVVEAFPHAQFVWAGGGPEAGPLADRARRCGLADRIAFLGHRTDVPRLMKAADLFVFPSHFEGGCSSAIREAMVHRLPIVASDAGGIPDVLEDKVHGLVFPARNRDALLSCIRWALAHPQAMRRMASRARERIADFSAEKMVDDYEHAFRAICAACGGRGAVARG